MVTVSLPVRAQAPDPGQEQVAPSNPSDVNSRIFGILPNYRTVDGNVVHPPLTLRQKLATGYKDSTDWPGLLVTGAFAAIYQAENQNPTYGQGLKGYGKRFAASYGDQAIGNMVEESFLPMIFHEDPRYFRVGNGGVLARSMIALRQIFVTRRDSGGRQFNFSEVLGSAIGAGASNIYYVDSRTLSANAQRFGVQIGSDGASNLLKEFWPDIKQRFFVRHHA